MEGRAGIKRAPGGRMSPEDVDLEQFRGLVHKTASMVVGTVEDEYDDIVQVLWIKVWKAQLAYDPTRSRMTVKAYTFGCLVNQVKDIKKKRRRGHFETSLEGLAESVGLESRDSVVTPALVSTASEVYAEVEVEAPHLPNTLTEVELQAVVLLAADYKHKEAAQLLGLGDRQMDRLVRSVKLKLADWKPSAQPDELPPTSCVPPAAPRSALPASVLVPAA